MLDQATQTEPERTPLESRIDWARHRAAALTVRSAGGHYSCAQSIGFEVTRQPGETLGMWLGRPCVRCARLFEVAKQNEGKEAT